PMQMYALFFLVAAAIGGVAWVFIYPILSGERQAEKRKAVIAASTPQVRAGAQRSTSQKSRREQVEGTLNEIEQRRAKAKSPPISVRISQAGLSWSKQKFLVISAIIGIVGFLAPFVLDAGLLVAGALGFAGAFGLPRWLLKFLKKRREA